MQPSAVGAHEGGGGPVSVGWREQFHTALPPSCCPPGGSPGS